MEWIGDGSDVVLEVVSYNQRAIRFYEKFGFEKVGESEHMYRDKMPVMTMIRKGMA
jgi:ribosomal protein S18 acetylase RimI-like enzyme